MGYKMVFSDMDGTLLWKGVRVSVENSATFRKASINKSTRFHFTSRPMCSRRRSHGGRMEGEASTDSFSLRSASVSVEL